MFRQVMMLLIVVLSLAACGRETSPAAKAPAMPIHEAALRGDSEAIHAHIAAGTNLDAKDDFGSTPLLVAITFGRDEAALALIEGGAGLQVTNADGATPLHVAAFMCRIRVVQSLLDKGVDKSIRNNMGATARDSVAAPFGMVKPVYDMLGKMLGPLGLVLDYEYLQATRPKVAEMLQ
jgi:ankyrin repeat protein